MVRVGARFYFSHYLLRQPAMFCDFARSMVTLWRETCLHQADFAECLIMERPLWRIMLKNSKPRQRGIFAKRRSKSFCENWLLRNDPRPLVEKRTDDEVPHIISERTHQSFSKKPAAFGNRLFQQYRREADVHTRAEHLSS